MPTRTGRSDLSASTKYAFPLAQCPDNGSRDSCYADYLKYSGQAAYFRPFGGGVFAVSARAGAINSYGDERGVPVPIAERFFGKTLWRPHEVKVVAGALMYTKYWWWKRLAMRRIVAKAHGDIDTSRDFEYTDWEDLRSFTEQFGVLAGRHATASTQETVSV